MNRIVCGLVFSRLMGCASNAPSCPHPDQTTYSCESVSAGNPGCMGGPSWSPGIPGSPADAKYHDDPDKVFPVGCEATLPECGGTHMSEARRFVCTAGTPPAWGELL